jgi:alpha-galactosidase
MRKIILYLSLSVLFFQCNRGNELLPADGFFHIQNSNIDLALDTVGRGIVFNNYNKKITRCRADKPAFAIISAGEEIDFNIESVFLNDTVMFGGEAQVFEIQSKDQRGLDISMCVRLIAPTGFPNVLVSQVEVINESDHALAIDTMILHRYVLQAQADDILDDQAPFWAFCGGNYIERFDWIEPLVDGFYRENPMYPSGGNPYTGVWNPAYGIGIMSLEIRSEPMVLPVKREVDDKVEICIQEPMNRELQPGHKIASKMYAVLTHNGDVYNGMKIWSELLQARGLKFQQSSKSCYDPIWCGWGYEFDYTNEELLSTLPVAREMGIKWAVVDAGWFDRSTFWNLDPDKYPDGDISMRAFTDSVKALGMRPKLWFCPSTASYGLPEGRWGKKGPLAVPDEKMLLLDNEGNSVDFQGFGVSILCPAEKAVVEANVDFIRKAMNIWGFEGFKMDGPYLNQFSSCYSQTHEHKDSLESVYNGPVLLKAMYDEAVSIVPDAVFEICACGTNYSIYNMTAQNQTVSSDPLSSWQIRHRGKIYHALLNSRVAYYGDHVELSDGKNDFASTIGVGGVPGTKFTLVETREMVEGSKLLTAENKKIWKKYFTAYEKERPAEGHYLNLYDIVYDYPEIHVMKKENVLYYGLFSEEKFAGTIQLKGLESGIKYQIIDYIENEILFSNITGETNEINVEFDKNLLIKALPESNRKYFE